MGQHFKGGLRLKSKLERTPKVTTTRKTTNNVTSSQQSWLLSLKGALPLRLTVIAANIVGSSLTLQIWLLLRQILI